MKSCSKFLLLLVTMATLAPACRKEEPGPGTDPVVNPGTDPSDGKPRSGEYVLPVIETTDMHGYILDKDDQTIHYRLAYIADKVKDVRGRGDAYDKSRLLLLDAGDLYQGASVSNLQGGKPMYVAVDRMDYDAVALGNHEFDWGFGQTVDADATLRDYEWDGVACVNEVPVLCANLYHNGSRDPATRDYVIVEKTAVSAAGGTAKVRIGIVGFAEDYASSIMQSRFTDLGYSIREDFSIANKIAAELEASGQADATVLLIHGAPDDAAAALGPGSAFDLVLGGHTHQTMSDRTSWGLPYLQGGCYCQHYAAANFYFSVDKDGQLSLLRVDGQRTPAVDANKDQHISAGQNAQDLDEDILAVSEVALAESERELNDVIGYIRTEASTYSISGSGGRATVMTNWMCDILRRIGEADVAFVNAGGVRTYISLDGQSRRNITVADIYEMFPFGNATYVYTITYADLLRLFEYSMTSGGSILFCYMTGIDCYYTQSQEYTSSSGEKYRTYAVHSLRKDGTVIYQDKRWTADWASRTLTLAASEYLATSERTDYYTNLPNPLLEWNGTSRLLHYSLVDNENAVRVLRAESAASGGLLSLDTAAHFLLHL